MVSESRLKQICIPVADHHAYHTRKLKVATIGAGFSGLIFAHKLQHDQPELQDFIEHTIFEANDDVGGTWKVNTYPGVQCDVPAHIYAFPFDPNPNWSKFYADGDEILEYMQHIAKKWNLTRDVQFNSRVVALDWQEEQGKWKVRVRKDRHERNELFDVVVSAQGFLSQWKWPSIPGLHSFKGHKVHSAEWDHDYDYSHKRIGVIGNGSSGIQILPQMAKLDGTTVVSFQRGATWITQSLGEVLAGSSGNPDPEDETVNGNEPNGDVGVDMEDVSESDEEIGSNFNPRYTRNDKRRFRDDEKHRKYRKMLQQGMNKGFRIFKKGSEQNRNSTKVTILRMRAALNHDEELCKQLIPDWTLGCRRLTPGEGYLESFLLPTVQLEKSPIERVTETGIQTASQHHDLDVIVCATGFDVSHVPHYPVTGREGTTLGDKWAEEPESYLSVACPQFPNYFIFTGPNATVGHGTLITSMGWTADYIARWLRKIAREDIHSVAARQDVTDEFVRYGDQIHQGLTWTGGCKSWYKNHRVDGRVTATWPGSALLYREVVTAELRGEDFDIRYRSPNRWKGVLGNGFTGLEERAEQAEKEGKAEVVDLAFYL